MEKLKKYYFYFGLLTVILLLLIGVAAYLDFGGSKPKRVFEAIADNIKAHPLDWTFEDVDTTKSNRIVAVGDFCYYSFKVMENKNCGIKMEVSEWSNKSMKMVLPDTMCFNDDEVRFILETYDQAIEAPIRRRDSIKATEKEKRILKIVESCKN
jgi:hypothetical protein